MEIIDPFDIRPPGTLIKIDKTEKYSDTFSFPYTLGFDIKIDPNNQVKIVEINGNNSGFAHLRPDSSLRRNGKRGSKGHYLYRFAKNQYGRVLRNIKIKGEVTNLTTVRKNGTDKDEKPQTDLSDIFLDKIAKKKFLQYLLQVYEWIKIGHEENENPHTEKYKMIIKNGLKDVNHFSNAFDIGEWGVAQNDDLGWTIYVGDNIYDIVDLSEWQKFLHFIFFLLHEAEERDPCIIMNEVRSLLTKIEWFDPKNIVTNGNQLLRYHPGKQTVDVVEIAVPEDLFIDRIIGNKLVQKSFIPEPFQVSYAAFIPGNRTEVMTDFLNSLPYHQGQKVVVKKARHSTVGKDVHIFTLQNRDKIIRTAMSYYDQGEAVLVEQFLPSKGLRYKGKDGYDGCMRYIVDLVVNPQSQSHITTFEDGFWRMSPSKRFKSRGDLLSLPSEEELDLSRSAVHQTIAALFERGAFNPESARGL